MGPNDDEGEPGSGRGAATGDGTIEAPTAELRGGGLPPPELENVDGFPEAGSDVGTVASPLRGRPVRPSAPLVGTGDRYKLGGVIGKGGMGEVVAAQDAQIGREVAIKRMKRAEPSAGQVERFLREARIQGRLDHPAIPPVHELARDHEGRPYFVMKRVAGTTLAEVLASQAKGDAVALERFGRQRLLRAFADVCLAIEFAHNRGVIHRDLKPTNIMLGDFGEVYVLDWGIARVIGDRGTDPEGTGTPTPPSSPPIVESGGVTVPGSQLGTPGYMAPEQAIGDPDVDGRADVYALGCTLFEILACEPLVAPGTEETRAIRRPDPRPSSRLGGKDVPPELEALCLAATERNPDRRLATARELGERVQRYLDGDRDLAARRELAREHLARATAAFEADPGEAGRKTAMAEAGRALALDPTLAGAADLVGRLMIEPPREMPQAVADAIALEDQGTIARAARVSALGYLGFLVFVPVMLAVGMHDMRYVWATLVLVAINAVVSYVGWRGGGGRWRPFAVVATHVVMIFLLGRVFTPPLVAPGAAAVITMALMQNPIYLRGRRWVMVVGAMLIACLAPYAVEALGWMSRTMIVEGDDLVLRSPGLAHRAGLTAIVNMLWTMAILVVAAGVARSMARATRAAQHRLHLQSWQLRQLVP
jgi:serine/threonine-protein kinase